MTCKKINLDKDTADVLRILEENGFESYIVGGYLRDSLMGRVSYDCDVTTSALPEQVAGLFPKCIPTGIRHGTVTVVIDNKSIEVTTFRTESGYSDLRRPDRVDFTGSITEDLARRDFTMNAICYSPKRGIFDPFGGVGDIEKEIIRCVGNPNERFGEDALRILRGIRFANQLGFEIEERTLTAISANAEKLGKISAERIKSELDKTLLGAKKLELLHETGVWGVVIPEVMQLFQTFQKNPYHVCDAGNHSLEVVRGTPPLLALRWAALLHDVGKARCRTVDHDGTTHFKGHAELSAEISADILSRLRFDTKTKRRIITLVKNHGIGVELTPQGVKRAVIAVGKENFTDLILLKRADIMSKNPNCRSEILRKLDVIEEIYEGILGSPLTVNDLAIKGGDIMTLGYRGVRIGEMKSRLLEYVLEHPEKNTEEALKQVLKTWANDI